MVTKDYSKSRMRENRTYGSVRGGQSNLIPSTRLALWANGGAADAAGWDRLSAAGCVEGLRTKVHRVQRVVVAP